LAWITKSAWNPGNQEVLRIEHGTRIVTDLEVIALAEALECNPCWLLTGTE